MLPFMPVLAALAVILVTAMTVIAIVRTLRDTYLRNVKLDRATIRRFQTQLTEHARRASILPGQEVDISTF